MDTEEKKSLLADTINEGEKDKAVKLLSDWASQFGYKETIFTVLEPLLIEWGKLWMQGKLSLAHGYLSGKVAEEFYLIASQSKEFLSSKKRSKGTIILGNIEDDFHPLGRRLVNIFSNAAGWNIIDLGNDVPAELFVEKAIENKADIIAVSAMMFTTAKNIIKVRNEIDKNGLTDKVKLAVGGAVFKLRPELVAEIGGDATADNAIDAPALFDSLLKKN
ncbi:MAG: cobalamin-dependent protein [Bacteroidales bacterium]|nr:cobalamin-dependent protein [Bacteroidales bacterium]